MHTSLIKKYYFINSFEPNLIKCQDKNTSIIFRNYNKKKIFDEALKIKKFCMKNNYNFYLANNIELAMKLDLSGAYIPSFNQDFCHLSYSFKKKFSLIGSAHNLKEINIKKKQKVKKIFLSSVFKLNKNYLGIYRFKLLSKIIGKDVVALGGVNYNNINKVKLLKVSGFAGISYFNKKGPF
jgi:thiamine-phosphate pyrophosphorylase